MGKYAKRRPRNYKQSFLHSVKNAGRAALPYVSGWAKQKLRQRSGRLLQTRLRQSNGGGHSMRRSQGRQHRHGSSGGGDQMTSSFWNLKKDKVKLGRLKHVLAPSHLTSVVSGYVTCAVGQQEATTLTAYDGSGAAVPYILSFQDTEDMNRQMDGVEWVPVIANSSNLTRRLRVLDVFVKFTLKNQTSIPVDIQLYDLVPRRDRVTATTTLPQDDWANGIVNENINILNASAVSRAVAGTKPYQSQRFCQDWIVKKTVKFTLGAGSEHIHYVRVRPSYLLNREYTSVFQLYKGITTCVMMVIRGGLVHDGVNGTTTAASAVSWVSEARYKYTSVMWNRTVYSNYNALPTATGATNTILEDTDAAATAVIV